MATRSTAARWCFVKTPVEGRVVPSAGGRDDLTCHQRLAPLALGPRLGTSCGVDVMVRPFVPTVVTTLRAKVPTPLIARGTVSEDDRCGHQSLGDA